MKIEATTREEYFAAAGERETELRAIDAMIREAAPHLPPVLSGGVSGKMLGYGAQTYQPKSAKESIEVPVVMLAAQKNNISLYACALIDGQYVAEKYASRLGKVNCGKSCIRFKWLSDLNTDGMREMLGDIDRRIAAGEELYQV